MAIRSTNPKGPINLGLGDPTGLHAPPPASISAVVETIQKGQDNGYIPGPGTMQAREAIAAYHKRWDGVSYTAGDVTLVSSLMACLQNHANERRTESDRPWTLSLTFSSLPTLSSLRDQTFSFPDLDSLNTLCCSVRWAVRRDTTTAWRKTTGKST